jgi:hypothetical protein
MANEIKDIVKSVAGVVGTAAGTAVGLAAGAAAAIAGKTPTGTLDPQAEELYWREHFAAEPYYDPNFAFEDYLPAWRAGWEGRAKYAGRTFAEAERELKADFHWSRGESRLLWDQARDAVRAAWDRVSP